MFKRIIRIGLVSQMSSQTADGAKQTFRDLLRGVAVDIESYKESPDIAAHNASGIMLELLISMYLILICVFV